MNDQWARVPAGFFLNVADIWTRMHQHACIEVYNAPMTSTAVKITIIIAISAMLYKSSRVASLGWPKRRVSRHVSRRVATRLKTRLKTCGSERRIFHVTSRRVATRRDVLTT